MEPAFFDGYLNSLKGKLFGLLCEYEKGREWEKFLDSILIEFLGMEESLKSIHFYTLGYKLQSLRFLKYEYFRSTVFDCITLLGKVKWNTSTSTKSE